MTSNTTPSGEAFATSLSGNDPPYLVFDGSSYLNLNKGSVGEINRVQIGYKFPGPIKIYKFGYAGSGVNTANTHYTAFSGATIEVSDNGTDWTKISTFGLTKAQHVATYHNPIILSIDKPSTGTYFRLNMPTNYDYMSFAIVGYLQFYGRASS
jgi:hypothetical protein